MMWILGMSIRLGGVFFLGLALYFWVQGLFSDIYNFPCHVDVTQWVEATNSFARGDYEDAAERDRPILMLFLSAQWMKQGFSALDALTLNARISWVLCMTIFCAWALRMYNVRAAAIAMIFLFWSHSYSGLVLSVAGQLPFNALVVTHLFFGFGLARAKNPFAWMALGFLSFLLPLCKEQGFFFPMMSMVFLLYSSQKGVMQRIYRGLSFGLGAAPWLRFFIGGNL
jgi:hypothetical protein